MFLTPYSRYIYSRYIFCLISSILISLTVDAKNQKEYYVSKTGNDNNPGTKELPLATINKVRDLIRTINKNMRGDIIVYLRGGVYELSSTLKFSFDDSGFQGHRIVYKAYRDEWKAAKLPAKKAIYEQQKQ